MPDKRTILNVKLKSLKAFDVDNAILSIYFAKRKPDKYTLKAIVYGVTPKTDFEKIIKNLVKKKIDRAKAVREYEPETTDLDDETMLQNEAGSNWANLVKPILEIKTVSAKSIEELSGVDLMIIQLALPDGTRLFACKKLSEKVHVLKMGLALIFDKGTMDVLSENKKVIQMPVGIDFFVWEEQMLILDKKNYELVMNIRDGMKAHSENLIKALKDDKRFEGLEILETTVANNMTLLRRASKAESLGLYKEAAFLKALAELVKNNPNWNIRINANNAIVITPDNVTDVLHLLTDSRAVTLIKQRMIDVVSSNPVK